MTFKKKQPVFNVKMDHLVSFTEFASMIGKQGVFVKKLAEFVIKNTVDERFVTDKGEILFCFYATKANLKPKNLFIDERAILHFVKKYEKDLEGIGASSDALKAVIYSLPRVSSKGDEIVNLWQEMAKLSKNTKCVSELCQYLKDHFLAETYPVMSASGYIHMEPMFVFSKGKAGRACIALKKEALPYFLKSHKETLLQEAEKLNESTILMSLRGLLRELNMTENKDMELKDFIINNCLKDTFEVKNEEGVIQTLPCFSYTDERYLCIDKRALYSFVSRYQDELKKLGFKNFEHILNEKQKLSGRKKFYSLKEIQEMLCSGNLQEKLTSYMDEKGIQSIYCLDENKKEVPLFKEFYFKGEKNYYLPKQMLNFFLTNYQDLLESLGARSEFILDRSGVQKIPYKTSEMVLFDDFYLSLTTDARFHKELSQKIKTLFKDEMVEYQDAMGQVHQEPVFIRARSGFGVATVFKNKRAMKSFIAKYRDFLMKHKIKKEAIANCLGEKTMIHYSPEYIPLYDFSKVFHQSTKNISKIVREKYLDETYPCLDENGVLIEKPVFHAMQHDGRGMIFYGCKKDALIHFARKHQEELKISEIVLQELEGKIKIRPKTNDYITMPDLFKGMCKSNRNAITRMNEFVTQQCMNDMFVENNEVGALVSKPIFSYTRNQESGSLLLCIHVNGIETFFKQRASELMNRGIYPVPFIKKVKEEKASMKNLILNRLIELGRIRD